ncbi:hypothetical protein INT47_000173 [Mucor saturninus]|uniref:Uncharacterized protein n=1 Tax=Mucor saturninus TaxID=64648 RepID=A0A8H7QH15_9FUNG|nr:hypothetical protein INT47_000173 [Mucor saturninus]
MAQIWSDSSTYGCGFCELKGRSPDNNSYGKYFENRPSPLRTLPNYMTGNPVSIIANAIIDITRKIDLIIPSGQGDIDFINLSHSLDNVEFCARFGGNVSLDGELVNGIRCGRVKDALSKYYRRSSGVNATSFGDSGIVIASCAWINNTVYSSSMYQRRRSKLPSRSPSLLAFLALVKFNKPHEVTRHDKSVRIVKALSGQRKQHWRLYVWQTLNIKLG